MRRRLDGVRGRGSLAPSVARGQDTAPTNAAGSSRGSLGRDGASFEGSSLTDGGIALRLPAVVGVFTWQEMACLFSPLVVIPLAIAFVIYLIVQWNRIQASKRRLRDSQRL